jgi:hypothetical protein
MGILSKLNPYTGQIKLAAFAIAGLALIALAWSWHSRGKEIERLTSWQESVQLAVTEATVEPDKRGGRKTLSPEQALQAIGTLRANYQECINTLNGIDREAGAAGARSDAADTRLKTEIADLRRRYAGAQSRIATLEARRPAATPEAACAAVDEDSKAPWELWR